MDIKEIALKLLAKEFPGMRQENQTFMVEFAEALISAYKAELLNEVGEPVACRYKDHNGHWCFMGKQYGNNEPLYTSDQVAAAVLKATKPLEDQLAAAQEETRLLTERNATNEEYAANLVKALTKTQDQLAKAEQRVAEACSAYMLNKNYNSLEFDRKYSAKEFYAGQKSTVEFLAKMIRKGEWRKFVKEM